MTCLPAATRARILANIAKYEAMLDTAVSAMANAVAGGIKEYRFDSGEGSQRTEYQTPEQLTKHIEWLEARIAGLYRRLRGAGLSNLNLRRKSYVSPYCR